MRVEIVSDREFNKLVPDVDDGTRASLWEMWRDDLVTTLSKEQLVRGANSLLEYFGSKVLITDVDWDEEGSCYLWEMWSE